MKRIILLSLMVFFCWAATIYADIYDKGAYWTVDKDDKIVNKNGYPPDEKLLQKNNQKCIYTTEDILFDKAEYKNGKVIRRKRTQQEIQAEIEQEEKETEYRVILNRAKKIAIDQLEAEGYKFKYNHLDE